MAQPGRTAGRRGATRHFGKGKISHLAELASYGSRALLCYGGGSIKRNGI